MLSVHLGVQTLHHIVSWINTAYFFMIDEHVVGPYTGSMATL